MKSKIFTLLVLVMIFLSSPFCKAQILFDGDFSTTTVINSYFDQPAPDNVWWAWQNWQIDADATVEAGVCKYQLNSIGWAKNTWDIQLNQTGFPLIQGHSYRLTFDVKADIDRSFGVYLGENGGSWTGFIAPNDHIQYAKTYWETKTIDFNAACAFNNNHKLSFELGYEQINMYFDNISLVDLGVYTPSIGVIGSSVNGWDFDVDMQTTDGIHYTLSNYPLTVGSMKFRQDNAWCFSWGDSTFPSGIGYQLNSPNIPIPTIGNYNITFNRLTGEYLFVCVSNCPASIGILGTAVPPDNSWTTDVNMGTNDGKNYFLKNYTFANGEAKFRQNDSWNINWGSNTFPTGTGVQDGPNIPVVAGTFDVTFNIETGNYNFGFPMIGILGSSIYSWDFDVDMQTTDGVIYTLNNYFFYDGEVKFRQDNSWDINWGGLTFPTGTAYLNYPNNIPVTAGTYNVTFNLLTGVYNFEATCPFPAIQCPWDVYVKTDSGKCGAVVNYPEVTAATSCGGEGITIKQTAGLASGSFFPVGNTWNTFELTNSEGKTATCGFYVRVNDPPKIKSIPDLWPPNHKMIPIHLDFENNCGENVTVSYYYIYNISSNEPDNGLGDGDLANDWQYDGQNILLRAERSGKGKGRVYSFTVQGFDESYNWFEQMVTVRVPHDKGEKPITTVSPPKNHKSAIIEDENTLFSTNVWPNSSRNSFNLEVQSVSNEKIILSVFDSNGRLISNQNVSNKQITSFGENFSAGIYMVLVRQGNDFKSTKVVKQ